MTIDDLAELVTQLRALSPEAIDQLALAGVAIKIHDEEKLAWGGHTVEFGRDGWGLSHPPGCRRRGSLLDCPYNKAITDFLETDDRSNVTVGRYYVQLVDGGLEFQRVDK